MGGLFHLFDFHQSSTSRKLSSKKRDNDGLEAPRNSLELSIEESQCYNCFGDNVPYAFQVTSNSSKDASYPVGAPVKELVFEEIPKEPEPKRKVPSVIARLMGMDMIPLETKPSSALIEKRREMIRHERDSSVRRSPLGLKQSRQTENSVLSHSPERDFDKSRREKKNGKPKPRPHPQEEELQKFKKDFEAWQAARVWENSKITNPGNIPRRWLAQEHLNKEKMAFYSDPKKVTAFEKPIELEKHKLKSSSTEETFSRLGRKEVCQDYQQGRVAFRSSNFEQVTLMNHVEKLEKANVPTRIVILKPGPDKTFGSEESWTGSSEIMEQEGSIKDFLEEVKERLRFEIQGKTTSPKRDIIVRGSGIETPFSEKPLKQKQIVRHISKRARESVTRDIGMDLFRTESMRSYASEVQVNGPDSPDFISRDARRSLSERLSNVLNPEPLENIRTTDADSLISMMNNDESRLSPSGNILRDGLETKSLSFRYGIKTDENSPRNLVRSLSAPISGTSFGKRLLEDQHILNGTNFTRRKHETTENVPIGARKTKKERFNFKGKVSNLRHSLSFKGRFFGRKIQSVDELESNDSNFVKDIMSDPTVPRNLRNDLDNFTEVPPSPASICNTPRDEYCRTWDQPSPVSTLDIPSIEEQTVPNVFSDISSNLNELRNQMNKLSGEHSEEMPIEEELQENGMVDLEDETEAYIRDILVVSGLYDGSSDCSFPRWDSNSKPIPNWVLEKVEESYDKRTEENTTEDQRDWNKEDHKVLFELLNEVLLTILVPSKTMSKFKRKIFGSGKIPPPRGKKLLDIVWRTIYMYVYPECEDGYYYYSLDAMVSRDLETIPWLSLIDDEVNVVGKEIETWILRDLIGEIVKDLLL